VPPSSIPLFYQCNVCKEEKPYTAEYFYRRKTPNVGFYTTCKECRKARSRKRHHDNRERECAISREYAANHRDEAKRRAKKWYEDNLDYAREWHRDRYHFEKAHGIKRQRNLDPRKDRQRKERYVRQHPDRRKKSSLSYAKSPKGRAAHQNRRTALYQAEGKHTGADIQRLYELQEERCAYCGITLHGEYHADHMMPVSRGGSNWPDNLALTCSDCNLSKGAKTLDEWTAMRGW
jgi:hypothetical protein